MAKTQKSKENRGGVLIHPRTGYVSARLEDRLMVFDPREESGVKLAEWPMRISDLPFSGQGDIAWITKDLIGYTENSGESIYIYNESEKGPKTFRSTAVFFSLLEGRVLALVYTHKLDEHGYDSVHIRDDVTNVCMGEKRSGFNTVHGGHCRKGSYSTVCFSELFVVNDRGIAVYSTTLKKPEFSGRTQYSSTFATNLYHEYKGKLMIFREGIDLKRIKPENALHQFEADSNMGFNLCVETDNGWSRECENERRGLKVAYEGRKLVVRDIETGRVIHANLFDQDKITVDQYRRDDSSEM